MLQTCESHLRERQRLCADNALLKAQIAEADRQYRIECADLYAQIAYIKMRQFFAQLGLADDVFM